MSANLARGLAEHSVARLWGRVHKEFSVFSFQFSVFSWAITITN
jgi:hypothetical protein